MPDTQATPDATATESSAASLPANSDSAGASAAASIDSAQAAEGREHNKSVTAPKGFRASGLHCGIKRKRKDIALIVSDLPAAAAGVFTTNRVVAACVTIDKQQLAGQMTGSELAPVGISAIVVNSGNANACTGAQGEADAWTMIRTAADALGVPQSAVLNSSTGVIGKPMPMDIVIAGIQEAARTLSADGGPLAGEAILTTDTFPKGISVTVTLSDGEVTIGAIAKGSGMIAPNMATMLAFVTTDAHLAPDVLQGMLSRANVRSFNRLTVDGDTSTNDMLLMLANGAAGLGPIQPDSADAATFEAALEGVLQHLAKLIATDGEGATKLVEVIVTGARDEAEAAQAARSIANSNLVKTAIHGADANWGRVLCAVGYSGIDFIPERMRLWFNDMAVLEPNYSVVFDEVEAKKVLDGDHIIVRADLGQGDGQATFWTCDLSKDYIHINASYRS